MTHIMQRFSAVVAAFVVCSVAFADVITGKVVSVADGDTVTVLTPAKKQVKVRLDGVDAPEKAQAFGDPSKSQFLLAKKTMEINPRHPIIVELSKRAAADFAYPRPQVSSQ